MLDTVESVGCFQIKTRRTKMFKKMVAFLFVALMVLAVPLQAFATDYKFYDIQATGTDRGYVTTPGTPGVYRGCGSFSLEYMTNRLLINSSTHQLYFMGAQVDPWTVATQKRWQSTGSGTLYYNYNAPSFTDKQGYYTMFFRRNTDDTYAGGRHVKGWFFVE